jgi:HSP20 family protein
VGTELNRLHEEMNRLFDRWGTNGNRFFGRAVYPPLNLWEDENNLYVEAELPGLELNDLEMYVTGENQLSIQGERKQPQQTGGAWHRQERHFGSFTRLIELPSPVNAERVSADFKNGVLTVTLPKREEARPRRIEVRTS